MPIYNQINMCKSKDKAEEEKAICSELWKKTEKDGNEHGILIGAGIRMELEGDNEEIDARAWAPPLTVMYKNTETNFDFYHTHGEWDSPLSGEDIYTFLYIPNLKSMSAITKEHKYTIIRTHKTPVIKLDQYETIREKYDKYKEESTSPDKIEDENFFYLDGFRQSLCAATKRLSEEYHFNYIEEKI
jgi:hypothetical protein